VCTLTGEGSRGRRVGTCMVDGRDVGGEMIEAGLARNCPRSSRGRYAELEPEAARRLPLPGYCMPR
jgi:micrococcal nuclease